MPRATYHSVAAARQALERIVRGALGSFADSARWSDIDTSFLFRDRVVLAHSIKGDAFWSVEDRRAPIPVLARRMTLVTASETGPSVESIRDALGAAGWAEDYTYSADGPGGTVFAYVCREALCWVQASWDGGDDSDSTYVPAPGVSVYLVCVPRAPAGRSPTHK